MAKYRMKPAIVDAFRWTGDEYQEDDPIWICDAIRNEKAHIYGKGTHAMRMRIETSDGTKTAYRGDWIIRDSSGGIRPCDPEDFEATYEKIEEATNP